MPVAGDPVRRLTYWGDRLATVRGWVNDNEALVLSRTGQHFSRKTWAFAVPLSGPASPGSATGRRVTSRYARVLCWWAAP